MSKTATIEVNREQAEFLKGILGPMKSTNITQPLYDALNHAIHRLEQWQPGTVTREEREKLLAHFGLGTVGPHGAIVRRILLEATEVQ